ncbi:MAG: PTS sugar transporter subunit IIA [Burkholderiales bacterium]|nr:PTS sugar transporter subunit IIA [Burkholderiales bacterium]MDQ3196752.1 PTS sugar transporter subunit IIA [Pseudomonadota bacterium]
MNLIATLLPVSNIVIELDVGSKKRVFEQFGLVFENQQDISRSQVFDSLFAREKLGSTGLGQGVAIPHGRIKGLREAAAALARLKEPIPFDAPDGNPVNLIFALLVPERATDLHLQILSELAQMFSDKTLREMLLTADDPDAIHSAIRQWQPHAPSQRSPAR